MNQGLLILGAGQFGRMVKELAIEMGCFDAIDFLDDNCAAAIGKIEDYKKLAEKYKYATVAIGEPTLRLQLIAELEKAGFDVCAIVSPRAYVSESAKLESGVIVEPNATVQTGAELGKGVIVSSGAVVRHNARVGKGCHLDCNSVVASTASLPPNTKLEFFEAYKSEENV